LYLRLLLLAFASDEELTNILEEHLAAGHLFLLGTTSRPTLADFALYGQLYQFSVLDTTYSLKTREEHPGRAFLWANRIDDLSGLGWEGGKAEEPSVLSIPPTTLKLLKLIGSLYIPFLLANNAAITARGGDKDKSPYTVTFGSTYPSYIGAPFAYQRKCLLWLREHLASVLKTAGYKERTALEGILKEAGCWDGLVYGEEGVLEGQKGKL
jgi:hypothetical protein